MQLGHGTCTDTTPVLLLFDLEGDADGVGCHLTATASGWIGVDPNCTQAFTRRRGTWINRQRHLIQS